MESDIPDIEELIKYASLIRLNRGDIVEFRESRILHKYRPTHIDYTSVSDNPYITIPIEYFVKHDEKKQKEVYLKYP